jgi:PAS domain S-box-containing protein
MRWATMKLSTRLTIAMVTLVILTATTIGVLTYRIVAAPSLPRTLERLDDHARLLALDLESSQRDARAFIRGAALSVRYDTIIRARAAGGVDPTHGLTDSEARAYVAQHYLALMRAQAVFRKIRFIGIDDGGREIVSVEREDPDSEIRIVPDSGLGRRADRDYFRETIGLAAGEVYVSPIDLTHGYPEAKKPRFPIVRAATPVQTPDGRPYGILVASVDMRPVFARIQSAARDGAQVFVVNGQGDYLVHPDPAKTFGFVSGKPTRLQDDFPELAQPLAAHDTPPRVVTDHAGNRFAIGWRAIEIAAGLRSIVIEAMPYPLVMATADSVRDVSLLAGLIAVLCASLLAIVLARSLTRPLVQVTAAVAAFGRDEALSVPTDASGEIGVLARAFAGMAANVRDNTAALRREIEERQVAEEKFRLAVEEAPSGQIMINSDGVIILVNAEVERMFGYHRDELIGHPVEMLIAADLCVEHRAYRTEFVARPKARRMGAGREMYGVRKDGTRVEVEVRLNPISTANGLLVLSQIVDISDRKRAEAELRQYAEREQLFVAAVESSVDAIVTKTLDGTITGWNSGAERLFGYTAGEAIGKSIDIVVPIGLRSEARDILDKIARGEKIALHETVRFSKQGRRIDISLTMSPVKSPSGAIIGAAEVGRDITARKEARLALLESEQMARGIIDTALDAFFQMDETGTILDWSPQAEAMFGWSRHEILGRPIRDLIVVPARRAGLSGRLAQLLKNADRGVLGARHEGPTLRRDGKVIDSEISLTAFRRRDRYVINCFIRDVTEKKSGEEQLRQAQKMEAVGQLTGGIAHDFNNMLTVITATIDILATAVADKPQMAAIAKLIGEAANRGAELIRRLLVLAHKQPLQPKQTDINALVTETEKLLRPALGARIEIKQRLEPNAWPALIDPYQLTTAILNLGVNARDAMPNGGKLTLETANVLLDEAYAETNNDAQSGEYVMIAVSDTGTGIPDAIRERVFEPFFSTKEPGRGTGLGLSSVYGFVKQSGGHIKICSEAGRGTTVKLYLPRTGAAAESLVVPQLPDRIGGGLETILIAEDDAMVRETVIAQISALGYTALPAANAAEVLALIDTGVQFDLLFTDVMMPGLMNGRQLAEEVAKRRSPLRVLFTSGFAENAMTHQGRLELGVHLLAKPYRRAELARMIRIALDAGPEFWRRPDTRHTGTN